MVSPSTDATRTAPAALSREERRALAQSLADELGEEAPPVRTLLKVLIKRLGWTLCEEALRSTREIEEAGGLWSIDEKRRRTKGGTFFAVLKDRSVHARAIIAADQRQREPQPAKSAPLTWEERGDLVREALLHLGQAMTAKLTLIGRPESVIERHDFVVTSLEYKGAPSLPKGLPVPKNTRTTYTVYIAAKQWRKVVEPLKDPADQLIVEGFCMLDPEMGGIAVLAQSATTKSMLRQRRTDAPQPAPAPPQAKAADPPAPPHPPPPAPPSDEALVRALIAQQVAAGQTLAALADRSGLPLRRLEELHAGRPTTLTPAQMQTFLQKLRKSVAVR